MSLFQIILLIVATSAVAVADIFLKEAQSYGTMARALMSPWMAGAVVLYVAQIIIFTYLFISGTKLSSLGVIQLAFYAAIVLAASVFLFKETATPLQLAGVVLALTGVLLLNI